MTLAELYQKYGALMIQAEIINNQVMETKKLIAEEMQKPRTVNAKEIKPVATDADAK